MPPMLKVVKDSAGHTVAFGPDTDSYAPGVPEGGSIELADTAALWVDPAVAEQAQAIADADQAVKADPVLSGWAKADPQAVHDQVLKMTDADLREVVAKLAMAEAARGRRE